MRRQILEMQELQRHARPAPFRVHPDQIGTGLAMVSASFGPYSLRSSASSLSVPTASQVSVIALALGTTEATAPGLIPRLRAVSR